jgi:hypothetical protein
VIILGVATHAVKLDAAISSKSTDRIVLHPRRRAGIPMSRQHARATLAASLSGREVTLLPRVTPVGSLVPLPKITICGLTVPPAGRVAEAGSMPHSAGVEELVKLMSAQV